MRHLVTLLQVGLPTAFQFLVEFSAFALLTVIIASMSEVDMAAHQVAIHVLHFSFLPAVALGEAASVLSGQAIGAGVESMVNRIAALAMRVAVLYTALCTLVAALFASQIASWFTADVSVVEKTTGLLYISVVFLIVDGSMIVARGVLRGAGDVRFPAVVGITCAWVLTPPLCWWLGVELGYGAAGGWIGLAVEIGVSACIFWWRLLSGSWRSAARRTRARALA
jgi:MATE family multidrug resistance protein